MTKRKIKRILTQRYDALWLTCSIDTKKKIDELFKSAKYGKTVEHIIRHGNRLFSIIEFRKSNIEYTKMLIVSKSGIDKLNKLCSGLQNKREIRNIILKYFNYHCDGKCFENSSTVELITILSQHYYENRDRSMYCASTPGRYLSILYPVTRDIDMGVTALLNSISQARTDDIIKERIQFI